MSSVTSNEYNSAVLSTGDLHMNYESVFDSFP